MITEEIIDLNINDKYELILKLKTGETKVPIITFETFKDYYGHSMDLAFFRENFNKLNLDSKLHICNDRFNDLTK